MKIIGNNIGSNKNDGTYNVPSKFFKSILEKIGLSSVVKEAFAKNEKFNDILYKLYDNSDNITSFLLERGYKALEVFENDEELLKYVEVNKIKTKIKNGKILIGNIYKTEDCIKCVGIVLARENPITDNQSDCLNNEIAFVEEQILEQIEIFSRGKI